jgi:hypothetical protein
MIIKIITARIPAIHFTIPMALLLLLLMNYNQR